MGLLAREPASEVERPSGSITLRRAVDADWQECGRICYAAFSSVATRHGFGLDFPSVMAAAEPIRALINHPHFYAVVAESGGRIVGSSYLDERSIISAIGPVSVDPACQDHGVGRALMAAMIERAAARGAAGLRLVQVAYHNRSLSLYAKLGFDVRETCAAMHGEPFGLALPGYSVRAANPDDARACNALCVRVHGFDRAEELGEAIVAGTARVVEHLGRISGYTAGIGYFSHPVAESNDDLLALIGAAECFGTPGFLVPLRNAALFRRCLNHALRVFFVTNLMTTGMYQEPRGAHLPSVGY